MKTSLAAASLILLSCGATVSAHRLDEYLQATTISLEKDRIHAQLRLTPGVAVLPLVLAAIDTNGDGGISPPERRAYAERVLRDLSLAVDGNPLPLRLNAAHFPELDAMREGLGEIRIDFDAGLPRGNSERQLVFENRHQRPIAVYLVNSLVPRDPDIRVIQQHRDYEQSHYRLDYIQGGASSFPLSRLWLPSLAIVVAGRLAVLRRKRRAKAEIN
jgi:hypothetical protein